MGARRRSALLLIAAVTLLLSACGDGDDKDVSVDPAVSPTPHVTTPVLTPVGSATATVNPTATVTSTLAPTEGTPTVTATTTPTATPTPVDIARFVGVYDVSYDDEFQRSDTIAEVFLDGAEVVIVIWPNGQEFLALHGTPTADGRVTLEGTGGIPNDVLYVAEGAARFDETNGRFRIYGSSNFWSATDRPFVLDRPIVRPPSSFNDTYRFDFDPSPGGCECTTTATFTIAVDENGVGTSTLAADELDDGQHRQGTFDPDECLVTARGRVRCVLRYDTTFVPMPGQPPAGPSFRVTLMGMLPAGNSATGEGRANAPTFPQVYFLGGAWTAMRVTP